MDFSDPTYALWAQANAAASAKLEGREVPQDYVRPAKVEEFLQIRAADGWCAPSEVEYGN